MRKLIIAATAAATLLAPATAIAGDYLQEFEGRPNRTIHFTESAQMQPAVQELYVADGPSYDATPSYDSSYFDSFSGSVAPAYEGPAYEGPAYGGGNFCGTKPKKHKSKCAPAPMPVPNYIPAPAPTSSCAPSGCVYAYRNSSMRYDGRGHRVQ